MKNINLLILITFMFFGISCSKDENTMGMNRTGVVNFSVVDKQGSNLFNPNTSNYLESNNIKILHLLNGKLIEYSEGHLDVPRGFRILEPNEFVKGYIFSLHGTQAYGYMDLASTTYIRWNDMDTDTIQCQFAKRTNSFTCEKVWYNGNEVWDISKGTDINGWFKIVK